MNAFRRIALSTFAAPLALGLAACGGGDTVDMPEGEAVEAVAAPEGQQWADIVAVTPEGGWLMGNPEAPIRLVEYGSLTCPACANFSETGIPELRDEYVNSGRVSFEFRSVPLHGTTDLVLTRLIQCAPKEAAHPLSEQIWANLDAILNTVQSNAAALEQSMALPENQRFVAFAQQGGLTDFFAARGISTDQAQQCLSDFAAIQALAEKLQAQTAADGVNSTPTFFLNGARLPDTRWSDVEAALQRAGAR